MPLVALRAFAALMIVGLVLLGGLSVAVVSAAERPQPTELGPGASASTQGVPNPR